MTGEGIFVSAFDLTLVDWMKNFGKFSFSSQFSTSHFTLELWWLFKKANQWTTGLCVQNWILLNIKMFRKVFSSWELRCLDVRIQIRHKILIRNNLNFYLATAIIYLFTTIEILRERMEIIEEDESVSISPQVF